MKTMYKLKEVAEMFGVSTRTVYNWIYLDVLTPSTAGRSYRVTESQIAAAVDELERRRSERKKEIEQRRQTRAVLRKQAKFSSGYYRKK